MAKWDWAKHGLPAAVSTFLGYQAGRAPSKLHEASGRGESPSWLSYGGPLLGAAAGLATAHPALRSLRSVRRAGRYARPAGMSAGSFSLGHDYITSGHRQRFGQDFLTEKGMQKAEERLKTGTDTFNEFDNIMQGFGRGLAGPPEGSRGVSNAAGRATAQAAARGRSAHRSAEGSSTLSKQGYNAIHPSEYLRMVRNQEI